MKRTIKLGKIDYNGRGRKINRVEIEMTLEGKEGKGPVLSVCGNIWNGNGSDICSGGQNIDEIAAIFKHNKLVQEIHRLWKRWHLNDMWPGCRHQRTLPEFQHRKIALPSGEQKDAGWVYQTEHPEGFLCRPCPICGYKYGSSWLYEKIDADDLSRIQQIVGAL